MSATFNPVRSRQLINANFTNGPILYWMNRDVRMNDNWALIFAQQWAIKEKVPLVVLYNLVPDFLCGGLRQLSFKLKALEELQKSLSGKNITFALVEGQKTEEEIINFIHKEKIGGLVTDFSPLNVSKKWLEYITKNIQIPFYQVDAHNIIPCWIASPKQEFGAYTIRPKINKLLDQFLENFPPIKKHPHIWNKKTTPINWGKILKTSETDRTVKPVTWIKPGEKAAMQMLKDFIENHLADYAEKRNDPTLHALSNLSPYYHYGMLSVQRAAIEIQKFDNNIVSQESYLEEAIVRRELSDNYCYYNQNYDNFNGFPTWAQKSLNEHRDDPREYTYTLKEFETAQTHDDLWNAAQNEMVITGKMHGYMRMYWAKKILEWTTSPEEAQKIAIHLNDKYELDGRDPNGYVGIAWSIGGLHDRAWFDRPVFGKVRFMSYNGCKSKFDIKAYIAYANQLT
jgi:deoxyribodipyrimidine photo-lyase